MTQTQKLERWAEKEFKRNLDFMIVPDESDGYIVFGQYHITKEDQRFKVSTWSSDVHTFADKRSAISWCVADKKKNYNLARSILILDEKKQLLAADIYCRKTLGKQGKHEGFYEMINTKIETKQLRYNSINAELEKCINLAKYIQIRGFSNET